MRPLSFVLVRFPMSLELFRGKESVAVNVHGLEALLQFHRALGKKLFPCDFRIVRSRVFS